ncbi:MAG TPA: NAD(P)/FAD-dependent oxidoreductase [candidate division Zixibacteria bacterium]|nr:NAD(P)/FAD-dependent oxidoreductase [candidate division Zixibacteria bacterium]
MSAQFSGDRQSEIYDITIIGAGPVGLYGLYYAGLRLMKAKAVDMLEEVGGGLTALYPEKYIYDVAGFPEVLAKDLVKQLKDQAGQYPQTLCLGEKVLGIEDVDDDLFKIVTDKGEHFSRTVVICTGLGAYIPRSLDIPNIRELEGRGVFYFVREPERFRDKRILVVGGGDAAFDASLMLEPIARSVVHIHRNDFFNAYEDSIVKVRRSRVDLKAPFWELQRIEGEDWVERATIVNSRTDEAIDLEVDAIFLNLGFLTNLGPIEAWGLAIDKNAIIVDSRMRTNRPGIFAAGDIVTYDGKLKLISTGCGEVAVAVNNAKNYIDPKAKVSPGHSTEKHVPAQRKMTRMISQNEIEK